jgi:hypothetical protein
MRRIILSSAVCSALLCFSTLPHERHDFWRKVTEHKMRVLIVSTTSVRDMSRSEKNRDIFIRANRSSCKVPLFLSDFSKILIFLTDLEKYPYKFHKSPSSKSRVVSCGRTDGQTNTTKLIVAFRNFAYAPENLWEQNILSERR